jgi:hypothetical protein
MQNDGAMLVINRELAVAFQVIGSDERKEFSSWSADQPDSPVPPRRILPDALPGPDAGEASEVLPGANGDGCRAPLQDGADGDEDMASVKESKPQ